MNKSISIGVLLISNLIMLGPFTNMNFFSNAMPIEYNQDIIIDISDEYNSSYDYNNNNYKAMLDGHQLQSSIFDKYYGCNGNDDKYTTTDMKILHQTGHTQNFFERTAVGSCAEEVLQSSPIWVGEKAAKKFTGQPSSVSNLTNDVITTPTYFVWVDGTPNSDILFKASSTSLTINLSDNLGRSDFPQIFSSSEGNNVYVVWQDTTTTPGTHDIFFRASNDRGQSFSDVKNLSNNLGASTSPQISLSGNNVYVVWKDNTDGDEDIFFAASNDKGQSFSTPAKNLSNNLGTSVSQQISSSGNNVYIVWEDTTDGNRDIFFRGSTNTGTTFSDVTNLSENNLGTSDFPEISSSGNNVYVVWQDFTSGNLDIFFRGSTNTGTTFSDVTNLSENNLGASTSPQISSSVNNVYVVWKDNTPGNFDIFFAASNDKGQSFSTPAKNLSNNEGVSGSPQISSSVNNVYVVWKDNTDGDEDIFFRGSTNTGTTFSDVTNLSENNLGASTSPQISSSVNNVYVVWKDNTPGNFDIFFAASDDKGQTFSAPENLSDNPGVSGSPQISSSGNDIYVVWSENRSGKIDIFLAAGTDSGRMFSAPENLSDNPGVSVSPQIASSGNNVYVVWSEIISGKRDILFAVSNDGGETFSAPENLTDNPVGSRSESPRISLSGDSVYVVWQDFTPPGNFHIFFAASTDKGQTFSEPENLSTNAVESRQPQISSSGNNVYVVWHGKTPGSFGDTFFAVSTNSGQSFSAPENLSANGGVFSQPRISSSGNNVYVVWSDITQGDIFFRVSTNSGTTFSSPAKNLSENPGVSGSPEISSSGNNVYVVWVQTTSSISSDIFFRGSTNSGSTFSSPAKNLSDNERISNLQQISSSGNNVYVVWHDGAPGNHGVLFASSADSGTTFSSPAKNLSTTLGGSTFPEISSSVNNVYVVWKDNTPAGNDDIFFAASTDKGQTFSAVKNLSDNPGAPNSPEIAIRE